jgi:hypothetical protein
MGPVDANSANMSAAFDAGLPAGTVLPQLEGPACPAVEVKAILSGHAPCFAEYQRAGRWHLAVGTVNEVNGDLHATVTQSSSWRAPGLTWCRNRDGVGLTATSATCQKATAVERYWDGHEILSPTARMAGRTWRMAVNRRYVSVYITTFTAGRARVQIRTMPYG